jgi:hypothetical protein
MKWIKLGTGYSNSTGIDGRSSRLYHIEWLASTRIQTEKAEVFTEKIDECYRVGTELHMGGRRCEEAPRRRDTHGKLL